MVGTVYTDYLVHSGTFAAIEPLYVSTGCVDCAKKEINANFYTSTTWPRCLNAISIRDSMPATTKSVHSCTLIRRVKSKIVHGTTGDFVDTGHIAGELTIFQYQRTCWIVWADPVFFFFFENADIVTYAECCARIIWLDFVRMASSASICILDLNFHPHQKYRKIK